MKGSRETEMDAAQPDDGVVVDVVLEDGVLYLELANLANRPALGVTCSFDPPLVDVQGRDMSELRLFRRVEFLGPARRLRTLLDSVPGYFGRQGPTRAVVTVEYQRPGQRRRATTVTHDLELYRELAYRA
jgi:hypothetical protein